MTLQLFETEKNILTENLILETIVPDHGLKLFENLQSKELFRFIPQDPPIDLNALTRRYERWSRRQPDDFSEIWLNYAIWNKAFKSYIGTVQAKFELHNEVLLSDWIINNLTLYYAESPNILWTKIN